MEELYRRYSPSLYWVCMRYTRNRKDAEDMVHQVFMIVHQRLDRFRGRSSVYTWLYRIAVNECLQMLRKRKFDAPGDPEDIRPVAQIVPGEEWDAKLTLDRILGGADAETREIFFLIYLEGLKVEEVVGAMGISRATIHRKMAAFKIKVEKMGK
ncbi:MAG TPA: RNA polymerase sigma factor [Fibrobacteria bacterium]|nr:RNA polymerase sigma factor [Fibrobacteria bacterium]